MITFLEQLFSFSYSQLAVALWSIGIIIIITIFVVATKPRGDTIKFFSFISISCIAVIATIYMIGGTLRAISLSPAKGPIHWHADFRIFNCGTELDLLDPSGLSNKTGTPLVHEHGDNRIHIEGIPESEDTASLVNFIRDISGYLDEKTLQVSTNSGIVEMKNGNMCNEQEGVLQVFVWSTKDMVATQKKLTSFDYVISPYALVPPGDCIIFEFDVPKERTEYICEQYIVAEKRGDITILDL
ncbi:MAG: hypothetical protein HYT27_00070 [Parcubacteria group bacterium]|nr:hypothetical protein [Parcubacteria group bacterium]